MNKLVHYCVLAIVAVSLWSCARGQEFQVKSQEGAKQTNSYPRFNIKPRAATEQFTPDETNALMKQLNRDSKLATHGVASSKKTLSNASNARDDARREAEKTLREIEQSGKKN